MLALTFPGQGSQSPGMGEPWVDHSSWALVAKASDATGRDVEQLLLRADAEELRATENAQLATYVVSMITLDAMRARGIDGSHLAGHSLGEYSALTAAGILDFEDGVRLVSARGEAMRLAGAERPGTMAAVLGLDDEKVQIACQRVDADAWVANFNAPGQVVIAGSPEGVAAAGDAAKELGAKRVMPVKVSGAFHTPFMAPARDRLRDAIAAASLTDGKPVHANVDAMPHAEASEWSGLMGAQLCSPVRWRQTLQALADAGVTTFVEVGPGTIVTGMAKRTVKGATTLAVNGPADIDTLLEKTNQTSVTEGGVVEGGVIEGEHLFASERLVVSPSTGVFTPDIDLCDGQEVEAGDVIGTVGDKDVRSHFAGAVVGILAEAGERVIASQPVAWLRSHRG